MRIYIASLAIAIIATLAPTFALAGNQEVAQTIAKQLKASNQLHNYKVNIKYDNGTCWLRGRVTDAQQLNRALELVRGMNGIDRVVNELTVDTEEVSNAGPVVQPARLPQPVVTSTQPSPQPAADLQPTLTDPEVTQARYRATQASNRVPSAPQRPMPAMQMQHPGMQQAGMQHPGMQQGGPMMHQASHGMGGYAHQASYPQQMGGPVPAQAVGYGGGGARYDHPQLPNYAWPSYAAHPNYAAVTYPKVYSPTAWPYIGPFYPYPQVPLGWRKVALEWDDGWWWLDFDDKGWRH